MAKKCNVEPQGWVDFDIINSGSLEISKSNLVSLTIRVIDIKDINIEIPIRWIQTHNVSVKFINLNDKNLTSISLGESPRNQDDGFILATPHTSSIFKKNGYEKAIQQITNGNPANILAIVSVGTYLRYPGSSEFIGTYVNGNFEPTYFHCSQEFRFTYK